jgi:predicted RNA methylase
MKLDQETINVLDRCRIEGKTLFLPQGQLPRDLYVKVDKVLKSFGGKWDKKAKAHLFDEDPSEGLENVLATGEMTDWKKELQFFETPPEIVARMIKMADVQAKDKVLEPSAGKGAIVTKLLEGGATVWAVETDLKMASNMAVNVLSTFHMDFLQWPPDKLAIRSDGTCFFDKVVMNPPFRKQQDIDHVRHAFKFLKPSGTLVSVMSEGTFYRETKKAQDFRTWMDGLEHEIVSLDEGAFKASGTMVKTRLVKIVRKN